MTRRRKEQPEAPGQDSFLDIVANLVGILIILVMVIGVRAKDAFVEAAPLQDKKLTQHDVQAAEIKSNQIEADLERVSAKIKEEEFEIAYRGKERDITLNRIRAAELKLKEKRGQLDGRNRLAYDLQSKLIAASGSLEDLNRRIGAIQADADSTNVIEHLPTPMAKTVFGKELHLRLQDGRLTYVPWSELVDKLKAEASQKVWKLKDAPRITEVIGPVRGFRLKYTLKKTQHQVQSRVGVGVQTRVELDRFILIPVSEDLGQPLREALREESEFRTTLAGYEPRRTTVTIWVYPNSFNEFRELKRTLFDLGYLTAGRPMPEGHPIGGSPDGSRSSAQ